MSKIRSLLNSGRSYTLPEILCCFGSFLGRLIIAMAAVGLAQYVALPSDTTQLSATNYRSIAFFSAILVIADYLKDIRSRSNPNSQQTIIFETIGGAIETLSKSSESAEKNPDFYFSTLLRHIESVVKILVKQSETDGVRISANIMVPDGSPPTNLRLKFWGTQLDGREYRALAINYDAPLPGAPAAFVTRKPIYISDIASTEEYRNAFGSDKDYKCVLSIPVVVPTKVSQWGTTERAVCAVINIDVNVAELLGNKNYISGVLIPTIKPLINLIAMERNLLQ